MKIKTASWFTKLPADHLQVGISRGVPRAKAAGYRKFMALAPGAWFNGVSISDYLSLYGQILAKLNAHEVADQLCGLEPGKVPVLLCFENAEQCAQGNVWCHRHLAAQWLEDQLGITVEEVGHPTLDRFATLRLAGIKAPNFI